MAKTERIYVRVTEELKERINSAAEFSEQTITEFVEKVVTDAVYKVERTQQKMIDIWRGDNGDVWQKKTIEEFKNMFSFARDPDWDRIEEVNVYIDHMRILGEGYEVVYEKNTTCGTWV